MQDDKRSAQDFINLATDYEALKKNHSEAVKNNEPNFILFTDGRELHLNTKYAGYLLEYYETTKDK
tara:strand:+ start:103 stop:300 length:198 start_codon:yes stop_codon:yes gene_type:complete